jgi:hypothetical protein
MPIKPIDTTPRTYPRPIHPPCLQGDWRGGNVACQNIRVQNCETGEVILTHQAEPATRDPYDIVNIHGKFLERVEKDRATIKEMNANMADS